MKVFLTIPTWKQQMFSKIFLSQFVDHVLALGLALVWFLVGMLLSKELGGTLFLLSEESWTFFLGLGGLIFASEISLRFTSCLFFGRSTGNFLVGLNPTHTPFEGKFWISQFVESCQIIFPALWLFDWIFRIRGQRFLGSVGYEWNFKAQA